MISGSKTDWKSGSQASSSPSPFLRELPFAPELPDPPVPVPGPKRPTRRRTGQKPNRTEQQQLSDGLLFVFSFLIGSLFCISVTFFFFSLERRPFRFSLAAALRSGSGTVLTHPHPRPSSRLLAARNVLASFSHFKDGNLFFPFFATLLVNVPPKKGPPKHPLSPLIYYMPRPCHSTSSIVFAMPLCQIWVKIVSNVEAQLMPLSLKAPSQLFPFFSPMCPVCNPALALNYRLCRTDATTPPLCATKSSGAL